MSDGDDAFRRIEQQLARAHPSAGINPAAAAIVAFFVAAMALAIEYIASNRRAGGGYLAWGACFATAAVVGGLLALYERSRARQRKRLLDEEIERLKRDAT